MLRLSGGVAAFLLLTALPLARARAAEPGGDTELEVAVAEGSSTGAFGCGGQARVRYVRAAVEVRRTESSSRAPDRGGVTAVLGLAVDGARLVAVEPTVLVDEDDEPEIEVGDTWLQGRFGGHLRLGYRFPLFGIEGGAGVVIVPGTAGALVYPDAQVTIGPRDQAWVFGGVGSAQLSTQLAYALPFVGFGVRPTPWLRMEARWGAYLSTDLGPLDRLDLTWWVPCARRVAFRGGFSLGQFTGGQPVSHEASIGLQFGQ